MHQKTDVIAIFLRQAFWSKNELSEVCHLQSLQLPEL